MTAILQDDTSECPSNRPLPRTDMVAHGQAGVGNREIDRQKFEKHADNIDHGSDSGVLQKRDVEGRSRET